MVCTNPPPLTDDQITAVSDGEAALAVQQHLTQCPDCSARLAQANQIERALKSKLHRWDCPTAQELGNYYFKLSDREQEITEHLKICVRCSDELAELERFLQTEIPLAQPAKSKSQPKRRWRLGEMVAQLLPGTPSLAARGSDNGPVVAQAGDVTIFLAIESTAQGPLLTGQLAATDQQEWIGAVVEIVQDGVLQTAAIVDEWGGFRQEHFQVRLTDFRITSVRGQAILLKDVNFTEL